MSNAEDSELNTIKLLSWNIDGLSGNGILERTLAVCGIINKENPDVVFLQEVLVGTLKVLVKKCPAYHFIEAANEAYFTVVMLKKDVVETKESKVIPFTNSVMLRALQKIECTVKGVKCLLMTTHLESTKDHGDERKHQLKRAFHHMVNTSHEKTVIFGGDLNLRDRELLDIKGLPEGVFDVWQVTGSRKETEFTWDMTINTNLEWVASSKFKPQCRFDRIFIRHSKPKPTILPTSFNLIGLEKIPSCDLFPSDHWGLLAHFEERKDDHDE